MSGSIVELPLFRGFGPRNRYYIRRQLNKGGCSRVYLANDTEREPAREVALKITNTSNSRLRDFIVWERDVLRAGDIHNAPEFYDFGEHEGVSYLAMEYIRGRPLINVLFDCFNKKEYIPLYRVIINALSLSKTVADFHSKKKRVIGDLAPHNIMLQGFVVRPIDFGISYVFGENSTETGRLPYSSPEQLDGNGRVVYSSAVFSLGIILWEMITSRPLFRGRRDENTIANVLYMQIPSLSRDGFLSRFSGASKMELKELYAGLEDCVRSALIRSSHGRTQSAEEFAEGLSQYLPLAIKLSPYEKTLGIAMVHPEEEGRVENVFTF